MHRILGITLIALATVACGDDLPEPGLDDGPPPGCGSDSGCSSSGTAGLDSTAGGAIATTTTGSEPGGSSSSSDDAPDTVGVPDECDVTPDCGRGLFCVAAFVPEWGPEGKGPNECVAECVDIMDELRWCLDAAACCDPTAVCTDRGYCVYPDDESSGTDGSTDGGDSDGTTTG